MVVLAAGRGVRFGGDVPKPLLPLRGAPLLRHALGRRGRERRRSGRGRRVRRPRRRGRCRAGVEVLRNDAPEARHRVEPAGRAARTRRRAPTSSRSSSGLADQPLVGAEAYRRVARRGRDGAALAVATYGGRRGNPVLIGREHWAEALALTGDEGARVLLRRHGPTEVPCDGTGKPTDVDTPEDLAALEARWRSATASE